MNLIERYLGRTLVSHTLLVMMVLLLILGFSEFMIQLGKLSESYTLQKGVIYTLLKLPVYGYEIFPVAILIGTLIGLGGLANHAELTILRVTGWSIGRIFWGVMKSALLMWLVVTVIGETVAPSAESYAKKLRGEAMHRNLSIGQQSDFWLKDAQRYIHVGRVISDHQFRDISVYRVEKGQIKSVKTAKTATYQKRTGQGNWVLNQVIQQTFSWQNRQLWNPQKNNYPFLNYQQTPIKQQVVTLPIDPSLLQTLQVDTRYMSIFALKDYITFLEKNDLDAEPYRLAFWRKIATPLVIFGMIALVFPLIFGSQRQVSMGQRIFVGIMIGMSFHLLNQIFGNLTVVYHLPTLMGALLPSIVLIVVALGLLRRLR